MKTLFFLSPSHPTLQAFVQKQEFFCQRSCHARRKKVTDDCCFAAPVADSRACCTYMTIFVLCTFSARSSLTCLNAPFATMLSLFLTDCDCRLDDLVKSLKSRHTCAGAPYGILPHCNLRRRGSVAQSSESRGAKMRATSFKSNIAFFTLLWSYWRDTGV